MFERNNNSFSVLLPHLFWHKQSSADTDKHTIINKVVTSKKMVRIHELSLQIK